MIDKWSDVNRTAYMDFKEATESLCAGISHEELAAALGVSIATVRQARLRPSAKAHRSAPSDWKIAVARLAAKRVSQYNRLIEKLTR
jgi:NADH/NAD ratio-sensing transcriptional regulator Rex